MYIYICMCVCVCVCVCVRVCVCVCFHGSEIINTLISVKKNLIIHKLTDWRHPFICNGIY